MTAQAATEAPKYKKGSHLVVAPEDLIIIGKDTDDDNTHPMWDPRINLPIDDSMVKNIMLLGVIEDITVTPMTVGGVERLVVVDGRRRTLHAREANKRFAEGGSPQRITLRATARKGENKYLFGTKEAANRFRVVDDPIITARNCAKALDLGSTIDEIAAHLGVSDQHVRNYLGLLDLAPEVQAEMTNKWLTATAAMMLSPLSPEQQKEVVAELKEETKQTGKKPTVDNVKKKAAAKKAGAASSPGLTPSERIKKATALFTDLAPHNLGNVPKESLVEILNKICRAVTGRNLEQIQKQLAKETADAEKERAAKEKKKGADKE